MTTLPKGTLPAKTDADQHVDRCLSMIMHHPVVEEIASLIKKIRRDRAVDKANMEGDNDE